MWLLQTHRCHAVFNCCLDYPIFYPIIVLSGKAAVLEVERPKSCMGLSWPLWGTGCGRDSDMWHMWQCHVTCMWHDATRNMWHDGEGGRSLTACRYLQLGPLQCQTTRSSSWLSILSPNLGCSEKKLLSNSSSKGISVGFPIMSKRNQSKENQSKCCSNIKVVKKMIQLHWWTLLNCKWWIINRKSKILT